MAGGDDRDEFVGGQHPAAQTRRGVRSFDESEIGFPVPDNARFFTETLPGHDAPLGTPGSATSLGNITADTAYVTGLPR